MIIGISGVAGSGKDTAADYLVSEYGFTKVSFAAILKNMLSVAGLPEPSNRDDKEKNVAGFSFTWREAAQRLGTEWGRGLDENIWVKMTMNSLEPSKDYVISDIRFDNEATAVINDLGYTIKIVGRDVDLGYNSSHQSEKGISEKLVYSEICNNSEVDYLYEQLDLILQSLKEDGNEYHTKHP